MILYQKRGLFEVISDTIFYYYADDYNSRYGTLYAKEQGFVKNDVLYSTRMLWNPYPITTPLLFEEDFETITEEDYKALGVDYIAIYKCVNMCYDLSSSSVKYEIASYRKYDGKYYPTASNYISLFKINKDNLRI